MEEGESEDNEKIYSASAFCSSDFTLLFFSQILFLFLHFHGFIVHLLLLWLSNNIAASNQHFLLYARYCSNQFYMYSLINHSQQIYEIRIGCYYFIQEEAKDW